MGLVKCIHCGRHVSVDDAQLVNDSVVCQDCLEDLYVTCEECGELLLLEDAHLFNDRFYHESCLDEISFICERCGRREYNDDCYTVYSRSRSQSCWCDSCRCDYAYYCDSCGDYYDYPLQYDDDNDEYYCDCCRPTDTRKIKSYHEHHGCEIYWTTRGRVNLETFAKYGGIGIELETEPTGDYKQSAEEMATIIEKILGEGRVHFERDGSLNSGGFEIITDPHTLRAFKTLNFKDALSALESNGYRSHDGSNCGLHIHFSKKLFGTKYYCNNLAKVIWFYHKYFKVFSKLSRRGSNELNRWAGKYESIIEAMNIEENTGRKGYALKWIKDNVVNAAFRDRYKCINLRNSATVEFRMGRGTLKFESFQKWIDLHTAIVVNSHNVSNDNLNDLDTWLKGIGDESILSAFYNSGI